MESSLNSKVVGISKNEQKGQRISFGKMFFCPVLPFSMYYHKFALARWESSYLMLATSGYIVNYEMIFLTMSVNLNYDVKAQATL